MGAHRTCGNRWCEIVRALPGRTEHSVKNHWVRTSPILISESFDVCAPIWPHAPCQLLPEPTAPRISACDS